MAIRTHDAEDKQIHSLGMHPLVQEVQSYKISLSIKLTTPHGPFSDLKPDHLHSSRLLTKPEPEHFQLYYPCAW